MMYKPIALTLAVLALAMLPAGAANAIEYGDPLVGDVFVTGFDGWTDTYVSVDPVNDGPPSWGVLLGDDDALCEANNIITGPNTSTRLNDAVSQNLINMNYMTTSSYTLTAKVGSWDDDGYGLIFGYADEDNYFRVGVRQQASNTYGFPQGISLQKRIAGTNSAPLQQNTAIIPSLPYLDGAYYDLSVTVDGTTGAYSVNANPGGGAMVEIFNGVDTDLIDMAAGRYGVHSWAQKEDASAESTAIKPRGTLVKTLTVDDGSDSIIERTHTFADAVPVAWRPLMMVNAEGGQRTNGFNYGNFRQDFRDGTIFDDSNAYAMATSTVVPDNIDFQSVAIVVDEAGSEAWTDYDMNVRVTCGDDEGPGVLVRVADDKTFYRVSLARQAIGAGRAPQGLSIQKCVENGENPPIWSELYRDDQADPTFVYTMDVPFDLKVRVEGNAITVSVVDDPDGAATSYTWDTVYDTSDAILSGSVGLTNWGAGDEFNGVIYSAYGGGGEGAPSLVTYVPEPSTLMLLGLLGVCSLAVRRRV